jgi:predicted RNase H-like HicB family nuclease
MKFKAVFSREQDGRYSAAVPAIRGCVSAGETLDEARANVQEAAELLLEDIAGVCAEVRSDEQAAVAETRQCFAPSTETAHSLPERSAL